MHYYWLHSVQHWLVLVICRQRSTRMRRPSLCVQSRMRKEKTTNRRSCVFWSVALRRITSITGTYCHCVISCQLNKCSDNLILFIVHVVYTVKWDSATGSWLYSSRALIEAETVMNIRLCTLILTIFPVMHQNHRITGSVRIWNILECSFNR